MEELRQDRPHLIPAMPVPIALFLHPSFPDQSVPVERLAVLVRLATASCLMAWELGPEVVPEMPVAPLVAVRLAVLRHRPIAFRKDLVLPCGPPLSCRLRLAVVGPALVQC